MSTSTRVQHEYQDMFGSFTCCVGSGMESRALHGDGLYSKPGTASGKPLRAFHRRVESSGCESRDGDHFP